MMIVNCLLSSSGNTDTKDVADSLNCDGLDPDYFPLDRILPLF